jgi:hypothetical protein
MAQLADFHLPVVSGTCFAASRVGHLASLGRPPGVYPGGGAATARYRPPVLLGKKEKRIRKKERRGGCAFSEKRKRKEERKMIDKEGDKHVLQVRDVRRIKENVMIQSEFLSSVGQAILVVEELQRIICRQEETINRQYDETECLRKNNEWLKSVINKLMKE